MLCYAIEVDGSRAERLVEKFVMDKEIKLDIPALQPSHAGNLAGTPLRCAVCAVCSAAVLWPRCAPPLLLHAHLAGLSPGQRGAAYVLCYRRGQRLLADMTTWPRNERNSSKLGSPIAALKTTNASTVPVQCQRYKRNQQPGQRPAPLPALMGSAWQPSAPAAPQRRATVVCWHSHTHPQMAAPYRQHRLTSSR